MQVDKGAPWTVGVISAGAMGRGIVQLMAQAGHVVICFDAQGGAAEKAVAYVNDMVARSVGKGRVTVAAADDMRERIRGCAALQEFAACDLVIEAVVEDLEAKRTIFRALETVMRPDAILASNTSSLTVAGIAAACTRPARVAGLQFFNPVPLMKVVEIIAAVRTSDAVVDAFRGLVAGTGHRAVVAQDQPGFLVNHAGRGLYTEGLRVVQEHVASAEEVDTLMREAAGFRMGPFELLDLTGLDVSGKVMESIYAQFHQEPRFRPSPLVSPRISPGLLGRKTGVGWYRYENGTNVPSAPRTRPSLDPHDGVWIDAQASDHEALRRIVLAAGLRLGASPSDAGLLIVQPWGEDISGLCANRRLDATRCVGIDLLPGLERHRSVMPSMAATPRCRAVRKRRHECHGDQRQPRLRRAAGARRHSEHRCEHRTAAHRRNPESRRCDTSRPRLSVRSAGLGRPPWWQTCTSHSAGPAG